MDFHKGILFFYKAQEKVNDDKMYLRWVSGGYDQQVPFNEFKNELMKAGAKPEDNRTAEDILDTVRKIINKE